MNFYKTVCIVALVVLVVSLAFIGSALASSSKNMEFPPNISKCPENYETIYDEYGEFSLHIYDIRGNLVKKLKTGRGSPGSYKLAWNSKDESGKKVTSGVYICQLKTSQKVHNSRMLLLK
ncbi:MAG: FlgD immunoglobulin-like domain containing protein [Candidatus Neomarinimicrobiota bacterium]